MFIGMSSLRYPMPPVCLAYTKLATQMECRLGQDGVAFLPQSQEPSLNSEGGLIGG